MRKQDYLVALIQTLSPSEKKYFRQFIAARHDSKDYEKLFDILQKAEVYDAEVVSRSLRKSKKKLADDKEYLQEILLRALQNFHANSMYRARCFNTLIETDILAGKGMGEFALSHLRKLKRIMLTGEENLLYYMMLSQETNIAKMSTPGGLKAEKAIKASSEELVERLQAILLYNQLVRIAIHVLDLSADIKYVTNPSVQKKAAAMIQDVTELVRGRKLSTLTYTTYHKLLAEYYLFLGVDSKLSVQHAKKALQRYDSETEAYKQFYIRDCYLIYNIMMQGYFALNDYRNMELCLTRIDELRNGNVSRQFQSRADRVIFRHTFLMHTATGSHEVALAFLNDNLQAYKKLGPAVEDISVAELMRSLNLFHLQRYGDALQALLPLLSSDAPAQLPETRITVRALNLMIQYEIGNRESLPDYIRSSDRFFKKEKLVTKEVKLFLELMQQLHRHGNKASVTEYQKRLEDVYALHHFELIGHFALLPWLKRFPRKALS